MKRIIPSAAKTILSLVISFWTLFASESVFSQQNGVPKPLPPGIMTTVKPYFGTDPADEKNYANSYVNFGDTSSRHSIPEILASKVDFSKDPDLGKNVYFMKDIMAKDIRYSKDAWYLEFGFKNPRLIYIDVPVVRENGLGEQVVLDKKLVWYMIYSVTNTGKQTINGEVVSNLMRAVVTKQEKEDRSLNIQAVIAAEKALDELEVPALSGTTVEIPKPPRTEFDRTLITESYAVPDRLEEGVYSLEYDEKPLTFLPRFFLASDRLVVGVKREWTAKTERSATGGKIIATVNDGDAVLRFVAKPGVGYKAEDFLGVTVSMKRDIFATPGTLAASFFCDKEDQNVPGKELRKELIIRGDFSGNKEGVSYQQLFDVINQVDVEDVKDRNFPFTLEIDNVSDMDQKVGLQSFAVSYPDQYIPLALGPISRRENAQDPRVAQKKYFPTIEISKQTIEPGETIWGVATWTDVDPRIGQFSIFVSGLNNIDRWEEIPIGEDGAFVEGDTVGTGRKLLRKVLKINFWKRGDQFDIDEKEIHLGYPGEVDYEWVER